VRHVRGVLTTFEIVAESSRRRILDLLRIESRAVGELVAELGLAQSAVSKHLRVLREAGLVTSEVDAQRRLYRLNAEPLRELDAWVAPYRRHWEKHLDDLERHLDTMADGEEQVRSAVKGRARARRVPRRKR
jgi:DNA-binding transcriptional ArsR family regulator